MPWFYFISIYFQSFLSFLLDEESAARMLFGTKQLGLRMQRRSMMSTKKISSNARKKYNMRVPRGSLIQGNQILYYDIKNTK